MNRISVIIPTFNSQKTIQNTLESVLNQSKKPFEIIVSDNLSTDDTIKIVRNCLRESTEIGFKLLSCPTPGSGPNRNMAVAKASGEVLTFLDSDDLWDSNFLEQMTQDNIPSNCIRGAYARYSNSKGIILGSSLRSKDDNDARDKMLRKGEMPFLLSTWVMRRETFTELGGFNPNYFVAQDFEFMYRHLNSGGSLQMLRTPMITYMIHAQSETTLSHLQQKMTMHFVLSSRNHEKGLDEYLASSSRQFKFKRWAKSDSLIRRFVVQSDAHFSFSLGYLFVSAILSPIRFTRKIINQRPFKESS